MAVEPSPVRVLFVPAVRRGMGSGHVHRTAGLARELGSSAALLLEGCREAFGTGPRELVSALGLDVGEAALLEAYAEGDADRRWDLIVLDRRGTSRSELERFNGVAVVGFDEGGEARAQAGYIVDLLPTPPGLPPPNEHCPGLLFLAGRKPGDVPKQRAAARPPKRILVSFGGEDPADLSRRMIEALVTDPGFDVERLTVVEGPLFRRRAWPPGVTVLHSPPRLADLLGDYDLVLTSFGLTTFEALAAGTTVVNLNPSPYHRRLSRAAGIPEIGVGRPRPGTVRRMLRDPSFGTFRRSYDQAELRALEDVRGYFERLRPDAPGECPVCGTAGNPAVARFPRRSYFACRVCGLTYLVGFGLPRQSYGGEYFGEEYRRQYGRTYLEDFDSIAEAGLRRVQVVRRLLGVDGGRLLDVGCAYGPFLSAAREAGFEAEGLDLAAPAVEYVRQKLRMPCRIGDFEAESDEPWEPESFDALTLWYVIEHFRDPARVLARAARLLRPGGVLALSTPNGAGVSGRRDREAFLRASPADHRTVWNPNAAGKVLARFGFRASTTVVTGHHPERFPWPGGRAPGEDSVPGRMLLGAAAGLSRALGLGDTFEVYAVRRERPE